MQTIEAYKAYSPLDPLSRCGQATACLGPETLPDPDEKRRRDLSAVRPSGWHATNYDQRLVPGESLYNRTHLIAWGLCDELDNPRNLITGTQHLNQRTMQPLEDRVIAYIRSSGNHVMYRVTPVFEGDELVARGVRMEARSVEDDGAGISFSVFCGNVQPGVAIDYATGESRRARKLPRALLGLKGYLLGAGSATADSDEADGAALVHVLNFATRRFHRCSCSALKAMAAGNLGASRLSREVLEALGFTACGCCDP